MNKRFLRDPGRHRAGRRSPAFAVKFARRLRARKLPSARGVPYRPAREITLEIRRRERIFRERGRDV